MAGNDYHTRLLLHCDGADESTDFPDASPAGHAIEVFGDVQVDTAQQVFGTGSALFDGVGDFLKTPTHTDWQWGSDDVTVDYRVRFADVAADQGLWCGYASGENYIKCQWEQAAGVLRITGDGGSGAIDVSGSWSPAADTWYHHAIVRHGSDWYIFVDGTDIVSSGTPDSDSLAAVSWFLAGTNYTEYLRGWLDEVRVSTGIARWTTSFSPPTEPYSPPLLFCRTRVFAGCRLPPRRRSQIIGPGPETLGGPLIRPAIFSGSRLFAGCRLPPRRRSQIIGPGPETLGGPSCRPPLFLGSSVFAGRRLPPRRQSKVTGTHRSPFASHYQELRGLYRIFNYLPGAGAEPYGWRVYHAVGSPPEAVPGDLWASSSAEPFTPNIVLGDGVHYFSMAYFNGVLESGFRPVGPNGEPYLVLTVSGGAEVLSSPQGPYLAELVLQPSGVVRVIAQYNPYADDSAGGAGSMAADEWAIAYTVNGAAPPTDTPDVTEAMSFVCSGHARLVYDLPGQADGTTVKVRIQTRRDDGSWNYSEGSEVLTAIADAVGPAAPDVARAWAGRLPEDL